MSVENNGCVGAIAAIIITAIGVVLMGFATMWVWNWLFVDLFNAKVIDYPHAVTLFMVLALVGGLFRPVNLGDKCND